MKKFVIALLALLITTTIVFAVTPKKKEKPSDYAIGIKYELALKSKKPSVVLFYTDWCTFCRRFMPTYEELSKIYKDKYNFVMVNAEKNPRLADEYYIGGYPSLFITDPKIDNRVFINNTLYGNKALLKRELDRYLRVHAKWKH